MPRAALVEHYRAALDTGPALASLWLDEVGVFLAAWRLERDAVDSERLYRLIENNRDNEPLLARRAPCSPRCSLTRRPARRAGARCSTPRRAL